MTFNKESTIINMMYRDRLTFRESNVSLIIGKLNPEDEGDYHLNLNIEFHNRTGLVIKEERTVRVTVDGECFSIMATCFMSSMDSLWKFTNISCFFLSPCVHSSH